MRAAVVLAKNRLYSAEVGPVIVFKKTVHRDRAAVPPVERAEPDVVGLHEAHLYREEYFGMLRLQRRADLPQGRQPMFPRQVVFHFIEADIALAGVVFPGVLNGDFIAERFHVAAQHQLPQPRRTLQPVARQLQVADALVAVEFFGRADGFRGDVVGVGKPHAGKRHVIEFKVAVPVGLAVGDSKDFIKLPPHGFAPQAIGSHILQADQRDYAQGSQRYPRCLEQVTIATAITVYQLAAGVHQLQALDESRHAADVRAGAMGGRGQTPGDGLLINIRHIDQRLARLLQRRTDIPQTTARPECRLQRDRVMADHTTQARQ